MSEQDPARRPKSVGEGSVSREVRSALSAAFSSAHWPTTVDPFTVGAPDGLAAKGTERRSKDDRLMTTQRQSLSSAVRRARVASALLFPKRRLKCCPSFGCASC
jgi:hypothetical protein